MEREKAVQIHIPRPQRSLCRGVPQAHGRNGYFLKCPVCLWQLLIMCVCWDLHEENHFSFLSSSSHSSSPMPCAHRLNTNLSDGQRGADRRQASTVTVEGYVTVLWPLGINRLLSPVLGVQVETRSGMAGNGASFRSVSLVLPVRVSFPLDFPSWQGLVY